MSSTTIAELERERGQLTDALRALLAEPTSKRAQAVAAHTLAGADVRTLLKDPHFDSYQELERQDPGMGDISLGRR